MARVRYIPAFFQPGFRLLDGNDINFADANPQLSLDGGNTTVNAMTQAAALAFTLVAAVTQFTVASANPAFALPPSGVNKNGQPNPNQVTMVNDTGSTITAFPGGANDVINGQAAGASITIVTGRTVTFTCVSDVGGVRTWKAVGGTSTGNIT